jgi:hypothetical protein
MSDGLFGLTTFASFHTLGSVLSVNNKNRVFLATACNSYRRVENIRDANCQGVVPSQLLMFF